MNKVLIISVCCLALITTGCGVDVKKQLGLDRQVPDEFSVMKRAPLEIPKDFTNLPKPQPGMQRPQDVTAKDQAKQVILGEGQSVQTGVASATENSLLKQAGAVSAPADIRQTLAREATETKDDKRPVIKRLMGIGKDTANDSVVDAEAEAKRIQDTKKSGQPVTTGDTPTIED